MEPAVSQLRKAITTLFKADDILEPLLRDRIYQKAPKQPKYPYMIYSENNATDWGTDAAGGVSGDGKEHTINLQVHDDEEGTVGIEKILQRCYDLLQHDEASQLILTDHRVVNIRFLIMDVSEAPDGQSYQGTSLFRAITEET